jgi:hypothetical protein
MFAPALASALRYGADLLPRTALSGLFSSTTITMCAGAGSDCAAATGAGPATAQTAANAHAQRFMRRV